VTSDF